MTREKAVEIFRERLDVARTYFDVHGIEDYTQAMELAVEVLSQEPSADVISRRAAIDALNRIGSLDTDADMEYARGIFEALPSAQPETHEKRTKTHACDCISRQSAIDAADRGCEEWKGIFRQVANEINQLPSAQPEKRTDKRTETHACDLISRQAAIEAMHCINDSICEGQAIDALCDLPSAQPEIIRCKDCGFWDRETIRHQCNDFRDWNEAECKVLAERDGYNEISHYVEADDYCSYAERKIDG